MPINTGILLVSTSFMDDVHFEEAIVFITEHNHNGSTGFVINQRYERRLNDLIEFNSSIAFPLYNGGPVDHEHLFFIHTRPDLIEGSTLIAENIYLGGNFAQAITHINQLAISEKEIKIFVGYCGWDDGQLDEEIKEGSWQISKQEPTVVFDSFII